MTQLINLSKKAAITLQKKGIFEEKVNVVLALDISGSMSTLYRNGTVQSLVERILGIGLNMDIDKKIEVHLFGSSAKQVTDASESNHVNFVRNEITNKHSLEGQTLYAPVMNNIAKDSKPTKTNTLAGLFKKNKTQGTIPTVVFFITDGDCSDKPEVVRTLQNVSTAPIFWQYVGIGGGSFQFLEHLDNTVTSRHVDNANFFAVNDLNRISDEDLYERILDELPTWIKEVRNKGMI